MTAVLESLKIVEKRPSAAFFKKKEVEDTKDKEKKKEKFQAHRTKNYNEKAKENQPIKMVWIVLRSFYAKADFWLLEFKAEFCVE